MEKVKDLYEFAEELREKVDIVEYISQYVKLKKRGKNYMGLCPFHPDKNPSFSVSREKGLFHCFGCGVGGNIYHFIMKIEGVDFVKAVEILAKWAGVEIPKYKVSKEKREIFNLHEIFTSYFEKLLHENKEAMNYLKKRGLKEEVISKFRLGYAPEDISFFLKEKKIKPEIFKKTGLYPFSHFRGRLIFPIFDTVGRVIGFSGRTLKDEEPKYINSGESVFKKREALYGIFQAKDSILKNREVVLVEGYMDVIMLHQNGIENSVSSMGTSFTIDQGRILKRFADRIYICFDPDTGGIAGTKRALDIAETLNFDVRIVKIPENLDPDEYVLKNGKESFFELLKDAPDVVTFLWSEAEKLHKNDESAVPLVKDLIEIAKRIRDEAKRFEVIRKIAERTKFPEDIILNEIKRGKKKKKRDESILEQKDLLEREFLSAIVKNEEFFSIIKDEIDENYFFTERYRNLYRKITSNLTKDVLEEDSIYREMILEDNEISEEVFFDIFRRFKLRYLMRVKEKIIKEIDEIDKEDEERFNYLKLKLFEIEKEIKSFLHKKEV